MIRDAWYAAAWAHELTGDPLGRRICGEPVTLFRDRGGRARCVHSVCPHRGADLSRGRLRSGELECPLHGWRFDGAGLCTHVPSGGRSSARARTFEVREQQGLVWIWPGSGEPASPPPRHAFRDEGEVLRTRPRRWRAPFVHVMEQALDAAHVAYVHRGSTAMAAPVVPEARVTVDADRRGFTSESALDASSSAESGLFARARAAALGLGPTLARRVRFDMGGAVHVHITYRSGWDALGIFATPADAHSTWVFGESVRTRARHPLGRALQRRYLRRVMAEDRVAAEALHTDRFPEGFPLALSVASDRAANAFRALYRRWRDAEQVA